MDLIVLIGIAIGLAMDAFAVSIGVGIALGGASRRQTFRLAWHFALFQALMPVAGWFVGTTVHHLVASWDHWLAFGLLSIIGGRMIWDAVRGDVHTAVRADPTRGWSLVVLSVATSIDALAVGFSFAALGVEVWGPAVVIGLTAGLMTLIGIHGGVYVGRRFGARMEAIGGGILIAIGCWIVVQHLWPA